MKRKKVPEFKFTPDAETKFAVFADETAWKFPDEYARFLSHCKHWGIYGALSAYQSSQDLGIVWAWAAKVEREHPEIDR